MADYQSIVTKNIIGNAPDGSIIRPIVLPGAGRGARIIGFALLVLPPIFLDANGLSKLAIMIGGSDRQPVRLFERMTWTAPIGPTGRPTPMTGGLFLIDTSSTDVSVVPGAGPPNGLEFYIEFEPTGES